MLVFKLHRRSIFVVLIVVLGNDYTDMNVQAKKTDVAPESAHDNI